MNFNGTFSSSDQKLTKDQHASDHLGSAFKIKVPFSHGVNFFNKLFSNLSCLTIKEKEM